ncbi:MAG: helix-turn-helix domain-containing protein [Bryobacteraceae bacterium]
MKTFTPNFGGWDDAHGHHLRRDRRRHRPRWILKLLSPVSLATQLEVSEHTLANWRAAGTGPAYARVGGLIRYRDSDVAEWVESRVRRMNDAPQTAGRELALSVLGRRPRIHGQHRLGRHQTQQDRRDADGGEVARAGDERPCPRTQASGAAIQ